MGKGKLKGWEVYTRIIHWLNLKIGFVIEKSHFVIPNYPGSSSLWVEMYVNVNVVRVQTEHSQTDTSTTIWLPSHCARD